MKGGDSTFWWSGVETAAWPCHVSTGVELARQRTPVVSALSGLLVSWLSSLVYCDEFPF